MTDSDWRVEVSHRKFIVEEELEDLTSALKTMCAAVQ
jgi:hypothetical protein